MRRVCMVMEELEIGRHEKCVCVCVCSEGVMQLKTEEDKVMRKDQILSEAVSPILLFT